MSHPNQNPFQHQSPVPFQLQRNPSTGSQPPHGQRQSHGPVSSSPEPAGNTSGGESAAAKKHQRNYQACDQCRARKVKCDVGDVDNPAAGPCKKCAREKKTCTFAPTRKKDPQYKSVDSEEPATKRARKDSQGSATAVQPTLYSPSVPGSTFGPQTSPYYTDLSQFPSPTAQQQTVARPLTMPMPAQPRSIPAPYAQVNSNFMPSTPGQVHVPTRPKGQEEQYLSTGANNLATAFTNTHENLDTLVRAASVAAEVRTSGDKKRTRTMSGSLPEVDPRTLMPEQLERRRQGLSTWSRMRFVRAGWFTAEEALDFMEYFYTKLAPMTPAISQEFRDPARHHVLLAEEPVLALAILSIASRHMTLNTTAGVTRNYYIHEKVWNALRKIVQRLLWGQEQFGGGFCGAGQSAVQETGTGQITWKGGLRTLGTIEALLLLTDWQPRALHFPPDDEENRLIDTDPGQQSRPGVIDDPNDNHLPLAAWLEPAWRSDRMSWMLLGLAQSLSFELGVFDIQHTDCGNNHGPESDCVRKRRLRRMVITYVAQISGRIGIQSSLYPSQDRDDIMYEGNTVTDRMQKLWFDIASVMFDANREIFPSRRFTYNLIQTNAYKQKIAKFLPRLEQWKRDYELVKRQLQEPMRHVLSMEYEYARLYLNSLGLQKVLNSWIQQGPVAQNDQRNQAKLVPIVDENKHYINEVRQAATSILKSIAVGLTSTQSLRDAPVRTFLRGLSGMMFSLKLFSLGNDETSARESLKLLRAAASEMDTQAVDDVHLSPHTAGLIKRLVDDVQRSMIRVQKPGSRDASRQLSPHLGPYSSNSQVHQPQGGGVGPGPGTTYMGGMLGTNDQSPDPLAQIPFANYSTQTFVPPPNMDPQSFADTNMDLDANLDPAMFANMTEDWLTMPLDNLFSTSADAVHQGHGGIGPTVNDQDMLQLLTGALYDRDLVQNQMNVPQGYNTFNPNNPKPGDNNHGY